MIQRLNKYTYLLLFIGILSGLFSCQKNETYPGLETNVDRVIAEFTESRSGSSVAMDFSNSPVTIDLTELRLYTRSWARGDVKVRVINDPTVVADYNLENGTSYTAVPSSAFTFDPEILTLTETDRTEMVKIRINPSVLLGGNYAIGLSIADVEDGEVSQLFDKVMVVVAVKNKYDGMYDVTGSCVDAAGIYTGIYPRQDVGLRTAGADAVDYLDPDYTVGAPFDNNAYIILNSGTGGGAWLYSPRFVFNTTTNKAIAILDTDGMVPFGTIDPAGPNQFTITSPNNKSFSIKYTALGGRFTITENWTYTGPR